MNIDETRFLRELEERGVTGYKDAMDAITRSKRGADDRAKIMDALTAVLNPQMPEGWVFEVTEGNKAMRFTVRKSRRTGNGL